MTMFLSNVSAEKFALVRVVVFCTVLVYVLATPLEYLAYLPVEVHARMGPLLLLPDATWVSLRTFEGLLALRWLVAMGATLCVLGTVGYRWIAPLTVLLWLTFEASLYVGAPYHRHLALFYAAAILSAFPSADALSLRARSRAPWGSPALYRAGMRLIAFSLLFGYTAAAL